MIEFDEKNTATSDSSGFSGTVKLENGTIVTFENGYVIKQVTVDQRISALEKEVAELKEQVLSQPELIFKVLKEEIEKAIQEFPVFEDERSDQ